MVKFRGFAMTINIGRNDHGDRKADTVRRINAPIGGSLKRCFDFIFAATALLALLPLLLIISVLLRCFDKGPVFFVHQRIGFGGKPFGCFKFRTMVVDAEIKLSELLAADPAAREEFERNQKLKHDPRVVPVIGPFLRSSSLDELPQFVNVLLGHMSVVGPRPVTGSEFKKYGSMRTSYMSVRPGITGLWQVSGRNGTTFEERVAIDKRYIQQWSMNLDLKIIWKTFEVVSRREGAY